MVTAVAPELPAATVTPLAANLKVLGATVTVSIPVEAA
jgi:hypothetical protein